MNKKVSLRLFGLISLIVLLLGFDKMSHEKEKPFQLLGYAVMPDISATMDKIEKIAGRIDPVRFKPNSLKGQVGMILGDPALKNFDNSKPAVAMVFFKTPVSRDGKKRKSNFGIAAFIPVKDPAPGQYTLTQMKFAVKVHENILVIGDHEETVNNALENIALYKTISGKQLKCDVRLLVKIDNIMETFKNDINKLINTVQASTKTKKEQSKPEDSETPDAQNYGEKESRETAVAIGKIVMYGLLDMARQSVDYRLDITFREKTVTFESEHTAKPGSELSKFFQSSPTDRNKCLGLLPREGQLAYAAFFEFARFKNYLDSIINESIKREPSLKKHIDVDIIDMFKKYMEGFSGEMAFRYGLSDDGKIFTCYSMATGRSEEENLAAYEEFLKAYNALMKKNFNGIGFSDYSLQRNIRIYKNVNIHRYVMKSDYSQIKDQSREVIGKIFGDGMTIEFAVVRGFMAGSTDTKTLDKIIDRALTIGDETELFAMKVFGKGMDSYADLNLIDLMEKAVKIYAAPGINKEEKADPKIDEVLQLLKKFEKDDRYILAAGKYNKGVSFGFYQIPLRMIIEGGKYFNSRKKQPIHNPPKDSEGDKVMKE